MNVPTESYVKALGLWRSCWIWFGVKANFTSTCLTAEVPPPSPLTKQQFHTLSSSTERGGGGCYLPERLSDYIVMTSSLETRRCNTSGSENRVSEAVERAGMFAVPSLSVRPPTSCLLTETNRHNTDTRCVQGPMEISIMFLFSKGYRLVMWMCLDLDVWVSEGKLNLHSVSTGQIIVACIKGWSLASSTWLYFFSLCCKS